MNKLLLTVFILFICVTNAFPKGKYNLKMRENSWHNNNLYECNKIIDNMNHKYIMKKDKIYRKFIAGFKNRCIVYIREDPEAMWVDISVVEDDLWYEKWTIQEALLNSYEDIMKCKMLQINGIVD